MKRILCAYDDKYGSYYDRYQPDYNEPEIVDVDDEIELHLDAVITIDENGNWEYEDERYPWAMEFGKNDVWYVESYRHSELSMKLASKYDIVEYVDELLELLLPYTPGKFRIEGDVKLAFEINNIRMYAEYLGGGGDERDDPQYDLEYITDSAQVEFLPEESSIENFRITEL